MTVHVSGRSISALLLLSVSLMRLPADALAQSLVEPQKTAPTLAERLDRLAAEFDRNRIDLHVRGAVLAIVRGDDVIFARGFGVADIEKKLPVTPNTPFFIGSTTKAFTATLVGMLVDEGRMRWDDNTGRVVGLKLHEGGLEFEVPREGVVLIPEIPLSELQKYVGRYGAAGATDFAILIRNERLAVRLPNNASFDLLPPDATGRRTTRANVGLGVTFEESPTGVVSAMNVHRPGAMPVLRLRLDVDLDGSVQTRTVLDAGRAWQATSGAPSVELTGKLLAQTRLGHPSVLFGDWRKYYDAVRVVREGQIGGRKVYGIQLESAGLPPTLVALDAETGDVLQTQQTMSSGAAGAIPMTTTYSDYREVGGTRVPHRSIASTDVAGRTIFKVERVEVNVELPPDTFTLEATSVLRASVPKP